MSERHDTTTEELAARFPDGPPAPVVVTQRSDSVATPTVVETPEGLPDVILVPLTVLSRLLIRAGKTYLASLLGLLGVGALAAGAGIGPMPFDQFSEALSAAALASIGPTVVNFLLNAYLLLSKLDERFPSVMG